MVLKVFHWWLSRVSPLYFKALTARATIRNYALEESITRPELWKLEKLRITFLTIASHFTRITCSVGWLSRFLKILHLYSAGAVILMPPLIRIWVWRSTGKNVTFLNFRGRKLKFSQLWALGSLSTPILNGGILKLFWNWKIQIDNTDF